MKRIYLLLTMTLAATFLSASVGFVVPDTKNAYESSWNYEKFPYDGYNDGSDHGECPERTAFIWYSSNNCTSSDKRFFSMYDIEHEALLTDGKPTVTALWFNLDRPGEFDDVISNLLNRDDFKNAVAAYVKAGGNVLLTKQAARLVLEMGRCDLWTTVYFHGVAYSKTSTTDYQIEENVDDETEYKLFSGCTFSDSKYSLSSNSGSANRECVWNFYDTYGEPHDVPANRTKFETDYKCKILAFDGKDTNKGGMIEFYPKDDFKGTILVIGTNAYDWGEINTYLSNVKQLTQNALDYLTATSELTVSTPSANPVICAQEDITATGNYLTPVSYATTDANVANINETGHIYYNHFGEVTFTVEAEGDGIHIPKNIVSASVTRTVTGGAPAPFAYVLPYSLHVVSGNTYDDSSHGNIPDYLSAKWFYDTYVVPGRGCFIRPTDYSSEAAIPSVIKVLWVHNDHVGQVSDTYRNDLGYNTSTTSFPFLDALQAFINRGGNVFLSKQATRLVGDLGRLGATYPSFGNGGYSNQAFDWGIKNKFFTESNIVDYSSHPVYTTPNNLGENPQLIDAANHTWRTNNNCIILENQNYGKSDFDSYEATHNCRLLGSWNNSHDGTNPYQSGVFVEFYPQSPGQGTIIMLGAAAYQWTCGTQTAILNNVPANVKNLTQNILEYLAPVIVTEPGTEIPSTVSNLIIYQGGSVSNTGDITVTHSITYIRPAVGGAASNELGHWYTFCLPFTPSHCYVEESGTDYEINSVYLTGSEADNSEPLGFGSFYLQTFAPPAGWAYIRGEGKPSEETPYIIKFLDDSENSDLADYFASNPTIMFVGGPQTISGTDNGTGGTPNGDYSYHVNHTLRKLTMNHVYPLNTATNMFEYDYGGPSEIMPFECYIKASTRALAAARPRFAIGRVAQQGTEITTAAETVAAPEQPLRIYDITGRLFHTGDEPLQLPQGIWIVRQGKDSRTIVIP